MISHLSLHTLKVLSDSISIKADENGFQFIAVEHPEFDAVLALHGGHLVHYQRKQQAPLIYLSKTAIYKSDKAIRGGVPICWPWFGAAGELGSHLPAHGFARTTQWQIEQTSETDKQVTLELSMSSNDATKAIWDHDFTLRLTATFTSQIELTLTTENTGADSFSYRSALHTYLNVADIEQCSVIGLAPQYYDSLEKRKKPQIGPLIIPTVIDAIYDRNEGDIVINDLQNQRKILISNTGNDSVVVWNPGKEGAHAFADMPDQGYKTMLCIESAITAPEGVTIKSGQSHCLSTVIR